MHVCAYVCIMFALSLQLSLGVVKADPASAKGVVQIMKRLNEYVPLPDGNDGEPFVIPCHGDQLSCERMSDARFAMGTHDLPANRLKGLEPTPGEFHHRCLTLQVAIYFVDFWLKLPLLNRFNYILLFVNRVQWTNCTKPSQLQKGGPRTMSETSLGIDLSKRR